MSRHRARILTALPVLALGLLPAGCATTATVVPGRTIALLEVQYPEARMAGVPMAAGEETPTVRMGRALLREIEREGRYTVVDARGAGLRAADLGKDAARTASLRQSVPADAYLGVRLLDCAARQAQETERRGSGAQAVEVTVYYYRGECTAELTAFDPEGKVLAVLQKTGRWDSPRQERIDGSGMQSQALTNGVDDTARRLARELQPTAAK